MRQRMLEKELNPRFQNVALGLIQALSSFIVEDRLSVFQTDPKLKCSAL